MCPTDPAIAAEQTREDATRGMCGTSEGMDNIRVVRVEPSAAYKA